VWSVSYENQNIDFNLPEPDSANRYTSVVPTVTLAGDTVTQIGWVYRNMSGAQIPPPAFGSRIELEIYDQGTRVYESRNIPVATLSHTLTAPVSWSTVSAVFIFMTDDLGNSYRSFWIRPPPE
jgi:hypothetical protein